MDPNDSNQDQSQQITPSAPVQNDVPQSETMQQDSNQAQPAVDTQSSPVTETKSQQSDPVIQAEPQVQGNNNPFPEVSNQAPIVQQNNSSPQTTQTEPSTDTMNSNYIEVVGEDLIDLLDEIEADDSLIEIVAKEMKLDKERVKATLTKLLDKIDQEQITAEELALIMASTVVDEPSTEQTPPDPAPTNPSPEPQQ